MAEIFLRQIACYSSKHPAQHLRLQGQVHDSRLDIGIYQHGIMEAPNEQYSTCV
jgi:hypothetical protein